MAGNGGRYCNRPRSQINVTPDVTRPLLQIPCNSKKIHLSALISLATPGGLPRTSDFRRLACPTVLKGHFVTKRLFRALSNTERRRCENAERRQGDSAGRKGPAEWFIGWVKGSVPNNNPGKNINLNSPNGRSRRKSATTAVRPWRSRRNFRPSDN